MVLRRVKSKSAGSALLNCEPSRPADQRQSRASNPLPSTCLPTPDVVSRLAMSRKYVQLVVVTLGVIALDQWAKFLVLERLTTAFAGSGRPLGIFLGEAPPLGADGYHYRPSSSVDLSQDFLRLRYAENPGAAFGLFRTLPEHYRGPLFHIVSLLAVGLIGFYTTRLTGAAGERWVRWGLPLVLGGALGNYADRLARGFVIDFVEAHWYESAWWPAFNVADSAITIGVGMLLIDSLVRKERAVDGPAVA